MSDTLERRDFLKHAGLGALGVAGLAGLFGCGRKLDEGEQGAGSTSPRSGPWWAQPSVGPGEHKLLDLPYGEDQLVLQDAQHPEIKGISAKVVNWHHSKHHAGYVKALNEIEKDLAGMDKFEAAANYSPFSELKRRETFNASGMILHNIYWQNMMPGGSKPADSMPLVQKIVKDFGSFDRWQAEFVATANTPNAGWAILCLAPYDKKLHNYACSFHDLGGVWGAIPLLALDVWEHAYYFDYGPDRGSYIQSFMRLVNWPKLDEWFQLWANGGAFK